MLTPERRIVKKLKRFNPDLFIKWNNRFKYFEVYLKRPYWKGGGSVLITPVTQSIYDPRLPKIFIELDERILWWLWEADSYRNGGPEKHAAMIDSRWLEWQKRLDKNRIRDQRDRAKDFWMATNAHYISNNGPVKNGKPKFNNYSKQSNWIRPDGAKLTSPRLFSRSRFNALKYNFNK